MFRNYIKTAWRNIRKHKLHTIINVLGMSVAFLCSIFLFLVAWYEFSFDSFHQNKSSVFKVYNFYSDDQNESGSRRSSTMGLPVASALKKEVQGVELATRYKNGNGAVEYNGKEINLQLNYVDNDFFRVFSFPVVSGNARAPLADPGNIVMSAYAAKTIFGKEDPIGKILKINVDGSWQNLSVSAILKDFPDNSSITYDLLVRTELRPDYTVNKDRWNTQDHDVYIKLAPGVSVQNVENSMRPVVEKYRAGDIREMTQRGVRPDANGDILALRLLPLSQIHFDIEKGTGPVTAKSYLYTLLTVGLLILIIAVFNFVNLNIAQAFTRIKEVGVRRSLGAGKRQIFLQVWGESFLICLASVIIGVAALGICIKPLNQLLSQHISLDYLLQPLPMLFTLLLIVVVSLLAGGYPAVSVSRLSTINVLKGNITVKRPGVFRNTLIVVQFIMACLLMVSGLIVFRQFEFMRTQPLGFSQESVISVPIAHPEKGKMIVSSLRSQLSAQPAVQSVTGSDINFGVGKDGGTSRISSGFDYNGRLIRSNVITVDYDFLKTMGIPLLSGRDFSKSFGTDTSRNVIVTESMAKSFGVENPLGLSFITDSSEPRSTIIGIIPDIHLYSLHEEKKPLSVYLAGDNADYIDYALVKIKNLHPVEAMNLIKEAYKKADPGAEFNGSFIEENVGRWYNKEKNFSKILGIATGVATLLSCLGLFAMSALMIGQRIKEIGVRKVLGASVQSIAALLSKDFLVLVLLAVAIATPLTWWLMNKWLSDFPYRVEISWWLFFASGIVALSVAIITISLHTIKAAVANPVKSLRTE
jgi:putative ABC transport system permease protein